ncbi:MAG: glycosyl transferase [Anaerolineaceae bacterium]|nr:glycosyl transferase [Anaerolineaceae bacterium]
MKLALVHDWLNQVGGAEDVLATLVDMYPQSPVYTSIYAPDIMPDFYHKWDIRTLWIDKLPGIHDHHQPYLPMYPPAWGGLKLDGYDVILSNKSGFCHGLQFDTQQSVHVCYCLAPTRYVWQLDAYIAREGLGKPAEMVLRPLVNWLKQWDYNAAQRVTHFIAISTEIQERIQTYYDRDSEIIFPPVETERFQPVAPEEVEDYFLIVSRLIPYKRIDLAVQAATRLNLPLKIGGKGRDMERLKAMAGPTVEFLGFVPDDELPSLMAKAKAFLFPGLEDFGITPVQAEAAGRPVIAYGGGGALDTVIPGVTGEHFADMTVDSLVEVMSQFDATRYDPQKIRQHALKFDVRIFEAQIKAFVEQASAAHQTGESFIWKDPIS